MVFVLVHNNVLSRAINVSLESEIRHFPSTECSPSIAVSLIVCFCPIRPCPNNNQTNVLAAML